MEQYIAFMDLRVARPVKDTSTSRMLERFVTVLQLLHDNMPTKVLNGGNKNDLFGIRIDVKKGCIIAPTLLYDYSLTSGP